MSVILAKITALKCGGRSFIHTDNPLTCQAMLPLDIKEMSNNKIFN